MSTSTARYRRKGGTGILTLLGVVDVFEAQGVHAAALRALNDSRAASVTLDLAQVEKIDTAILQIILSLKNSLDAAGRALHFASTPRCVAEWSEQRGVSI